MNRLKTIIFSLIPLIAVLVTVELAIRIRFYQTHSAYRTGIAQLYYHLVSLKRPRPINVVTHPDTVVFQSDPVLGYKLTPGVHNITFTRGGESLKFRLTAGDDGQRITSPDPEAYLGKPEIWILGCSFTLGWGINDEGTFPWRLQQRLVNWRIRNLGGAGYSNLHALLQMEEAVNGGKSLPAIAVFVFNSFHPPRNVGASWFLDALHTAQGDTSSPHSNFTYPVATISEAGDFVVKHLSLNDLAPPQPDPGGEYESLMTKAIFYRLWKLCIDHGIRPVFALQTGDPGDPVPQYAKSRGFTMIDFSVDYRKSKYNNSPFDPHPNTLANLEYETRMLPDLQQITSAVEAERRLARDVPARR
jgi:hypothetical protein